MIITGDIVHEWLPERPADAHKYTFGHAGLVAGSHYMPGAAVLMAEGATRGGCGLVSLFTFTGKNSAEFPPARPLARPEPYLRPEVMLAGTDDIEKFWANKQALGVGPGLGHDIARGLVEKIINGYSGSLLLDADALFAMPFNRELVVTPHYGEFVRLFGENASPQEMADKHGVVILLKGPQTIIARPGGEEGTVNNGNPGMATAGSGDVLAGLITALLAQGMEHWKAACCGAWLHAEAGGRAAAKFGQGAMRAGDIAESIRF
ncbi:MAG: NAD(P)H-hydrate dehydratase [Clostridia bacterium]|nr:NAD(P)H-hydrate dehydratase [Clostridia bacterium]